MIEPALQLTIAHHEISRIVDSVWSSMADIALETAPAPLPLSKARGYAVASVQIVGDVTYVVRLELELAMLQEAASRLLQVEVPELSSEDIRDAAGELANVVGGNIKRILSNDSRLSLPAVVVGTDFDFQHRDGTRTVECSFESGSGRMNVVLLQSSSC